MHISYIQYIGTSYLQKLDKRFQLKPKMNLTRSQHALNSLTFVVLSYTADLFLSAYYNNKRLDS